MVSQVIVDTSIDKYGEEVTLRTVTETFSDWGDAMEANSDSTITVVHNDIVGDEEFNKDGRFHPGDKVFFSKSSIVPNVNDKIIFNSSTYQIKDVITHHIQGKNFVSEIRCSKV